VRVTTRFAVTLASVVALWACGGPGPSDSTATEICVDLGPTEAVGLSWSQTGRYLGIGTFGPDGSTTARVIDSEGRVVVEPIDDADILSATVVVTPEGRPAWIERRDGRDVLVEHRQAGVVETEVPADIFGMGWTAVGFALLQLPPEGGTRILNFDVDRPGAPTVSYETALQGERLWISADPETKLLTIVDTAFLPPPISFLVVGAEMEHRLAPPDADADATGASMPSLRRWVVYHAPATSRMLAMRVADPSQTVVLVDGAARGSISDAGILAFVPVEPDGRLCLLDVSTKLR
jgi:hypothetical protein